MNSTAISEIDIRLFAVPLPEVLSDAKHGDHTHFELATVTVTLENGCQGTGYSYTGGKRGRAIHAMIKHDLALALIGKDVSEIEEINEIT
jgi:L-alanine-DL-glutamate epimerase-like enolase superfamily enzyme